LEQVESLLRAAGVLPRNDVDADMMPEEDDRLEGSDSDSGDEYEQDESANPHLNPLTDFNIGNDTDNVVADHGRNDQTASKPSVESASESNKCRWFPPHSEDVSAYTKDSKRVDLNCAENALLVRMGCDGGELHYIGIHNLSCSRDNVEPLNGS
jgi:hypothetical protein